MALAFAALVLVVVPAFADEAAAPSSEARPPMTPLTEDLHLDADPAKGEFPTWVQLAKSDAPPPDPPRTGPLCKPDEWVAVDFHKSVRCGEFIASVARHREAERAAAQRRAGMPGDIVFLSTHLYEATPSRCRKAGQPIGKGSAEVTFSPEGRITNVTLEPPFARSRIGECIIQRYKALNFGPFTGPPLTFKTIFHVVE